MCVSVLFFFKQKTAYEMRISDWSSDVCSSGLSVGRGGAPTGERTRQPMAIFFPLLSGVGRGCGGRWYRNTHRTRNDGFAMPGHHISDQQVFLFMTHRRQHTQAVAAAKAGISERSARRIENDPPQIGRAHV